MLLHAHILLVPSNEINHVNVYSNELVNNFHKFIQNTQQSCESRLSRSSCRACRACRVERVEQVKLVVSNVSSRAVRQARHSQNVWARRVERVVSCRDVTSQVEWNLSYTRVAQPQACCQEFARSFVAFNFYELLAGANAIRQLNLFGYVYMQVYNFLM